MKDQILNRLGEETPVSRPIAVLTGLWRQGHLRAPDCRDRRAEIRIPTNEPAHISLPLAAGIERVDTRVIDVSRGGLRISLSRELRPGSMVMVHLRDTDVMAEVRYCRICGDQHQVGLQVRFVV